MAEGANVGTAYVSIVPSAVGFGAKLQAQVVGQAAITGQQAGQALGAGLTGATTGIGKNMAGMFAALGIGLAASKLKDFAAASVDAASSLTEQASKAGVVFGEQAGQINRFAKNAADAVGLSERAALEATGTFGNLFRAIGLGTGPAAQMSTRLVTLGSDLASFNDVDPTVALNALRSGLVGETEPLRNFGVNMNDATLKVEALKLGLISSTSEAMSPAIKAQAAYALILAQTTTAQGDFARTSDSLANRQRQLAANMENLRATLGEALLPAMTAATGGMNSFLGVITGLPGPVQQVGTGLAVLAGGTVAVTLAVGLLAPKLRAAKLELVGMGAAGKAAAGSLSLIGKAGVAVGTILALETGMRALDAAIQDTDGSIKKLATTTDVELARQFDELGSKQNILRTALSLFFPSATQDEERGELFNQILEDGNLALAQRILVAQRGTPIEEALQKAYNDHLATVRALNKDQASSTGILGETGDVLDATTPKVRDYAAEWEDLRDRLTDVVQSDFSTKLAGNLSSALNPLEKFVVGAGTNIDELKGSVTDAAGDLTKARAELAKLEGAQSGTAGDIARIRGGAGDIDAARAAVADAASRLTETQAALNEATKSPLASMTENLTANLSTVTTWLGNLDKLAAGGHESLARHLTALGPQAADAVAEAVGVSPKQRDKLEGLFDQTNAKIAEAASGGFELGLAQKANPGKTLAELIVEAYDKSLVPGITEATIRALEVATGIVTGREYGAHLPSLAAGEAGPGEARRPPAPYPVMLGPAVPPTYGPAIPSPADQVPVRPPAQITIPFQVATDANPRQIAAEVGDHVAWRLGPAVAAL